MSDSYPLVVRGARIYCTFGSHMRRLDMPVGHGSYIREKPQMHAGDCKVGLDANIPPFGACRAPDNKSTKILIHSEEDLVPLADEKGNPVKPTMPITGATCSPELGPKWCDAQADTLVDGVPALTVASTITCIYSGVIGFIDDGQEV